MFGLDTKVVKSNPYFSHHSIHQSSYLKNTLFPFSCFILFFLTLNLTTLYICSCLSLLSFLVLCHILCKIMLRNFDLYRDPARQRNYICILTISQSLPTFISDKMETHYRTVQLIRL